MKQTRIHSATQKGQQKKPKGMYFLALFLLVAIFSATFINSQRAAMEDEISKSYSLVEPGSSKTNETEVPYIQEVTMPEVPSVVPEEEAQPEAEPVTEPEVAPVSAKDIAFTLPVSGVIAQDYAQDKLIYSETFRDWRTHSGLDISAETGTSVKAAAAGTIESIIDDPLYGTTVVIRHSDALVTKYSSLQPSLPVSIGNFVEAGAPIGNVGNTASAESSEGSHLHFEIIENSNSLNPKDFF